MMEVLIVITNLCNLSVGGMSIDIDKMRKEHIKCHKYYIECYEKSLKSSDFDKIKECIKERL
jgi:hypothetical protein